MRRCGKCRCSVSSIIGTQEVTNAQFMAVGERPRFRGIRGPGARQAGAAGGQRQLGGGRPLLQLAVRPGKTPALLSDRRSVKITGINAQATGYRLPTEAEWAYSIRQVEAEEPLRFPWGGNLPPPDRHGNYADRSAAHLVGRIIFGYNDNYIATAPVGTYAANTLGLYDMSGNVAEWVNDFYEIPAADAVVDPLGPDTGEYRVIRGSSWMHGTITDLRISFRDYGLEGRQDLGFRIARFAEPN